MGYFTRFSLIAVILILFNGSVLAVNLQISVENNQSTTGEDINVSVQVLNNSTPKYNTLVNFSTPLGVLNETSVYTNDSGIAVTRLNSTIAGNAIINASVNNTYNTTNISYTAGKTDSITIDTNPKTQFAGNITTLNFTLYDKFCNINTTANLTINVTISDVLGETKYQKNITKKPYTLTNLTANQANTTFNSKQINLSSILLNINSTIAGEIKVSANSGNITNTTNLTIKPREPHRISALYDAEYIVNTTSEITVGVYDVFDNPVGDATVLLYITPPPDNEYNSPNTYNSLNLTSDNITTSQSGLASTYFRTDKRAGDNRINLSVQNTSINKTIIITGVANCASDLILNHNPDTAYANNKDTYKLSAQTVDKFMNPVLPESYPIDEQVRFNTTSGSTLIPLNESGTATTLVGPTPYIEGRTVNAVFKNESGYTNVTGNLKLSFVSGDLSEIRINTNPEKVLSQNLNGNHDSDLTIVALDKWGHPLQDINLTLKNTDTNLGNFTVGGINVTDLINTSTNSKGKVYASFKSSNEPGNATITASNGFISQSTIVEVKNKPFLSTNITIEPESIDSGDILNITTIISAEGEVPITRPAANAMLTLDRSGSMDPDYYAGTPLDVILVLDRSGSMKGSKMDDAKDAAKMFVDYLVSNTKAGVVSFSDSSQTDYELTLLNKSQNKTFVKSSIDPIYADGSTALGDGLADANAMLENGRDDAKKVIVVLTDGKCNIGSDQGGEQAIEDAIHNGVTIHSIGLGAPNDIDELLLKRLASETGGDYHHAPTSSELNTIYNSIAQKISDYDIEKIEYGKEGFTPYNYQKESDITLSNAPYVLKFDAYDIDSSDENCYIDINGIYLDEIPVTGDGNWDSFEYEITNLMHNGTNTITFHDPKDWPNSVKNIEILSNSSTIASYPDEKDLQKNDPYDCSFSTSSKTYEYIFKVNESINDLKVQLDWMSHKSNMELKIISPNGDVYGINNDTTGYYSDYQINDTSEYIWIHPLSYVYPDSDSDTLEKGNWTVKVSGFGNVTEQFNITTYIDKKSATKIASHAFLSSFDEKQGDSAGLVLYSSDNVVNSNTQTSYLKNGSNWVGYFEGKTPQKTYMLNFTGWDLDYPYNGYGECYISVNGKYATSMPPPDAGNYEVRGYSTDITEFVHDGSNNISFYDYHDIYSSNWYNEIKNVKIFENDNQIESYQPDWIDLVDEPINYEFNTQFNVTTFNLTWNNSSNDLDLYLYKGTELVNYSNSSDGFEELNASLDGSNYYIVVEGENVTSESKFNLTATQQLEWKEWHSAIESTLNNDSLSHLNNSIDTITADGLTTIDEGMYKANNELADVDGNSTMVLMTDGLDNSGYHSLLQETQRASDNNTTIYAIGFGNNESKIDSVLSEIASKTGGEYYFAPNASVLKDIFRGIAADITNFTATGPKLNLHMPHNYITNLSVATADYIDNSSNSTTGNTTNFTAPTYPSKGNAEPNITLAGNETILTWQLPNLDPSDKWGVWYQAKVEGAGYVPLILSGSNLTYTDVNGTNIKVNISQGGDTDIGGSGADVNYITLGGIELDAKPPTVSVGETSNLKLTVNYEDGNPAIAGTNLHTSLGAFRISDNLENPANLTISGSGTVDFKSATAGRAYITVNANNGNNTVKNEIMVVVKPKGKITIK